MDVTLLELHLPDAEFNAPFAGRAAPQAADESGADREPAAAEPAMRPGPLAGLLALAGLALLARYLRGGEAEQATLDELEA